MPNMRYSRTKTTYELFRKRWFDYLTVKYELEDQIQSFYDKDNVILLHYLYDYGPRCEFNRDFFHLWSEYFQSHATLSKDKVKVLLTTKHQYSLNTLLAKEKSIGFDDT